MTPKEKAQELFKKYSSIKIKEVYDGIFLSFADDLCKQCALIAVNEIIESSPLDPNDAEEWLQPADWFSEANISADRYWIAVKKEIQKL